MKNIILVLALLLMLLGCSTNAKILKNASDLAAMNGELYFMSNGKLYKIYYVDGVCFFENVPINSVKEWQ